VTPATGTRKYQAEYHPIDELRLTPPLSSGHDERSPPPGIGGAPATRSR
jgi:hypothetical protein